MRTYLTVFIHTVPDSKSRRPNLWECVIKQTTFLGVWEHLDKRAFKPVEFDGFKKQAGLNSFTLTPKQWIEKTNPIGLISKAGRYGGTYGHKDIAFEFASWISVEFKLYLVKKFQRLKYNGDAEIRDTRDWEALRRRRNYHCPRDGLQRVPDLRFPS